MRPFATFQAESPYAEALTEGLRALRFRRDLKQFSAAEEMAAEAAKYERGHWFYRLTFPSRKGSTTRWFPSSRY